MPAYIIFSDVSLRQMARNYPASESEFARISGVGEKNCASSAGFSSARLPRICKQTPARFLPTIPSASPAPPPPPRSSLGDARETLRRFRAGQTVEQIARERGVTTGTILGHVAEGVERGEPVDLDKFFTDDEKQKVAAGLQRARRLRRPGL